MTSVLFTNVRILDGSGAQPFAGEVLVHGNRIARVARLGPCVAGVRCRHRGRGRGDLLLVDGDPVSDITVLQNRERILAVMKDGAFHREPEIASGRARWSLPAA